MAGEASGGAAVVTQTRAAGSPALTTTQLLLAGRPTQLLRLEAPGAPALVALHGSADSAAAFRASAAAMMGRYDAWLPQLPQLLPRAPSSTKTRPLALDDDLPWLDALMAATGARALAGHSYGALLSLRWALANPGALDRLWLCEPIAWHLIAGDAQATARLRELAGCLQHFDAGETRTALRWLVDYWNRDGFFDALPAKVQAALEAGAERTAAEVRCGAEDCTQAAELARLQLPVHVVAGAHTTAESLAVCRALAAALPQATLTLVPGEGHQLLRRVALPYLDARGA